MVKNLSNGLIVPKVMPVESLKDLKSSIITGKHFTPKTEIKSWEPQDFKLKATTHWSFPRRGEWATHKGDYRGNWAPEIPRNVILRYSKKGDVVLDPFVGSGTTIIETKLLGRKGVGLDINPDAIKLARARTSFSRPGSETQHLQVSDARKVKHVTKSLFGDKKVDLICTHPPYADIIAYTKDNEKDLSQLGDTLERLEEHHRLVNGVVVALHARRDHAVAAQPACLHIWDEFPDLGDQVGPVLVARCLTDAEEELHAAPPSRK